MGARTNPVLAGPSFASLGQWAASQTKPSALDRSLAAEDVRQQGFVTDASSELTPQQRAFVVS